jgi:hypothetical protein
VSQRLPEAFRKLPVTSPTSHATFQHHRADIFLFLGHTIRPFTQNAAERKKGPRQGQVGRGGARRAPPGRGMLQYAPAQHTVLILQILADPFETRFNPFTLERPRVCTSSADVSGCTDTRVVPAAPRQHPAHRIHL